MDLEKLISQMKTEELKEIERAAKLRAVSKIVAHTKVVDMLEKLERQLEQVATAFAGLRRSCSSDAQPIVGSDISPKKKGRIKGRIRREEFIEAARRNSVELILIKGQRYRIGDDGVVGIAYASERTPSKWFLGLPKDDYDAMVLLCEDEYGTVANFIFPKIFYDKYKKSFSEDRYGQVKFNVSVRDGRYTMKIPNGDDVSINAYINAFDNLEWPTNGLR